MIAPASIIAKANRVYPKAVKSWLDGELDSFFPLRVPANLTIAKDHAAAIKEVDALRQAAKETRGFGYSIKWETRRSRTHGLNRFPVEILIDSMDDLVKLIDRQSEWKQLQGCVRILRERQPKLTTWLGQSTHWRTLLEIGQALDGLLDIVEFFEAKPRPDCFAREIPLAVSTKLIENHRRKLATWLDIVLPPHAIDTRYGYDAFEPRYGLRYARPHYLIRALDLDLQTEIGLPFSELSLPAESLSRLAFENGRVIIVENKVNLLSLPRVPRTLALGGLGNAVIQLAGIRWLADAEVFYWGDLDADGFLILDRLRELVPHTKSLMMSLGLMEEFSSLATMANGSQAKQLFHLTSEEIACYRALCDRNIRIEQEHLPQSLVLEAIAEHVVLTRSESR